MLEETTSMIKGPLDIYMNPGLLEDLSHRQYHRSDDVYSLRVVYVVSFKIAMWESTSFHSMIGTSAYAEAKRIFQGLKEDHAADVGEIYQQAVATCLKGQRPASNDHAKGEGANYESTYSGEDP